MSEVKPTLIKEVLRDPEVPNTWMTNFSNWLWDDARGREYTWIIAYFTVITAKGYEYKVSFETPVENFGLTFPFVVKTQSSGVKKVSIYGVDYYARSKSNYGTSFIVSGSNFHFKSATRYKLEGEVFNIVRLFYLSPQFRNSNKLIITIPLMLKNLHLYNLNKLYAGFILTRFASFSALDKPVLEIHLNTIRDLEPVFFNRNELYSELSLLDITFKERTTGFCGVDVVRDLSPQFLNKQAFEQSVEVQRTVNSEFLDKSRIDTHINTSKTLTSNFSDRLTVEAEFSVFRYVNSTLLNRNQFNATIQKVGSSTCSETTWDKFGGAWSTCETWTS